MNLDNIVEVDECFTACWLPLRSQLKSVAVFVTSFWEWWGNPAAGPKIMWTFFVLSSGNQRVIVVEHFLFSSKIFVYYLSLLRKFRNSVVHAMRGNSMSGKPKTNKT